jgi:hypothetical protein
MTSAWRSVMAQSLWRTAFGLSKQGIAEVTVMCNILRTALFWLKGSRIFLDPWILEPWSWDPIACPKTSVINYHFSLRDDPEERSSQLLRGGSLKSHLSNIFLISTKFLSLPPPYKHLYNTLCYSKTASFHIPSKFIVHWFNSLILGTDNIFIYIVKQSFSCASHGGVWKSEVIMPPILYLTTRWSVQVHAPVALTPPSPGKEPLLHLDRRPL